MISFAFILTQIQTDKHTANVFMEKTRKGLIIIANSFSGQTICERKAAESNKAFPDKKSFVMPFKRSDVQLFHVCACLGFVCLFSDQKERWKNMDYTITVGKRLWLERGKTN